MVDVLSILTLEGGTQLNTFNPSRGYLTDFEHELYLSIIFDLLLNDSCPLVLWRSILTTNYEFRDCGLSLLIEVEVVRTIVNLDAHKVFLIVDGVDINVRHGLQIVVIEAKYIDEWLVLLAAFDDLLRERWALFLLDQLANVENVVL